MQEAKKANPIIELTFAFALKIVRYTDVLETNRHFVIARQLLKLGTSSGANVREAQNSESMADFIHKMKIAAKEADETEYWLLICNSLDNYPACSDIIDELTSIKKVLSKIIATSKRSI